MSEDPYVQEIVKISDGIIHQIERREKIRKVKKKVKERGEKIILWTWKFFRYMREHHKLLLTLLGGIANYLGVFILSIIILYYAYVWYPYYGVVNYIIGLIEGKNLNDFLYNHVMPWGIAIAVIGIICMVLYYSIWDLIFPRLYIVNRDGDEVEEGRVYFYSPESKTLYTNLDSFLNIFIPKHSIKLIHLHNEKAIKKDVGGIKVHAYGVIHLHDYDYAFTDEFVPQQEIQREIIERQADQEQAYIEYRASRSLRFNPEINKAKYKSTIILLPQAIFNMKYKAPEESKKGVIENLERRIETFEQIYDQALTDDELQEELGQKLAPLVKEIYEYSRALESYIPELKDKNDKFSEEVKKVNIILENPYFNENLNTWSLSVNAARSYVSNVKAVLDEYEAQYGGVEE